MSLRVRETPAAASPDPQGPPERRCGLRRTAGSRGDDLEDQGQAVFAMTRRAVVIVAAAMAVGIFASVRGLVGASGDEGRFRVARDRGYAGFGAAEEGAWRGSYYFVQLADPQLGMLLRDRSWSEELDMLRLAIEHVNRLRPRFVIVSGDLVNAFPEEDGDAAAREGEGEALEGALAELDARVGLVLQPGNHDLGQAPTLGQEAPCPAARKPRRGIPLVKLSVF